MKKRLILTILTALLFGACSNQNEVSQNETEKPVGFVQKEEKAKKERDEQEKVEKEKKAKEEQERKEKEEREKKEAEAKQLADQAEAAVQALENNQVTENIAPAQAAIANVADQGTKDRLTHRVGLVQNAITVREDKLQLPNKRNNNKHLSHNLNKGAIEIVVKHALQVLHHFTEDNLVIALA